MTDMVASLFSIVQNVALASTAVGTTLFYFFTVSRSNRTSSNERLPVHTSLRSTLEEIDGLCGRQSSLVPSTEFAVRECL